MAFTFFFRDQQILDLIVQHVIVEAAGRSRLLIWDAGCAMGPEPYSLAIMFAERMGKFAFKTLQIDATDIDGSDLFGDIISKGEYQEQELKRIPTELFTRYFQPSKQEGYYELDYLIRSRLKFQRHDLLSLQPVGGNYTLILCKNVLLHFSAAERVAVIRMFHEALAPGGFSAMEQTQKLPDELTGCFQRITNEGQLFRKIEVQK
jgi:chemotaxis protein methyltransferase CheR